MVAQRNRRFGAAGVPRLNAQSPSELRWRLRVEVRMICCFGSTLDSPRRWTSWTVAAGAHRTGIDREHQQFPHGNWPIEELAAQLWASDSHKSHDSHRSHPYQLSWGRSYMPLLPVARRPRFAVPTDSASQARQRSN
jgi:hypothetical protein